MTLIKFTEYRTGPDADCLVVRDSVTAVLARPNHTIICMGSERLLVLEPLAEVQRRLTAEPYGWVAKPMKEGAKN